MIPPHPFEAGKRINDDFEVIRSSNSGGMGQVYLCYSHARDHFYALKGLNPQTSAAFARDPFRFRREVETWIGLGQHASIVRCFTVLALEDQPFILAEWVGDDKDLARRYEDIHRDQPHFFDWYARLGEQGLGLRKADRRMASSGHGDDLESHFGKGVFRGNPTLAVEVALDICAGLVHINQVFPGAAHADLRPTNVLMTPHGRATINDFGITRVPGTASAIDDRPPQGSPLHMAPEQWQGQQPDFRTDMYALGVILFTLLMGYEPFDANSRNAIKQRHLNDPIPGLTPYVPGAEKLDAILWRCLAKAPADRFPSPNVLYIALADVYLTLPGAKALPNHPSTAPCTIEEFNQLGIALTWLGHYARADEQFRVALEADPLQASTFVNRGIALARQGRHSDALREFNQALRFSRRLSGFDHQSIKEYVYGKAKYNMAVVYFLRGEYDRAWEEIGYARSAQEMLVTRAAIQIALGQFDSAIADCSTLLARWPSFAQVRFNRGLAHLCQGDTTAAQTDFQALENDPMQSLVAQASVTGDAAKLRRLAQPGDFLPSFGSPLGPAGARQKAEFDSLTAQRACVARVGRPPFELFLRVTAVEFSEQLHPFVRRQIRGGTVATQLWVRGAIVDAVGASANEIRGLRTSLQMTPLPDDVRYRTLERLPDWDAVTPKEFQLVLDPETSQLLAHAGLRSLDDLVGRELRLQYIDPDDRAHPLRIVEVR